MSTLYVTRGLPGSGLSTADTKVWIQYGKTKIDGAA